MTWNEIRQLFPNQFVKLKILESYITNDRKVVTEAEVVGFVPNDRATEELLKCKGNLIVYHTSNKEFIINIIRNYGLRLKK